MKLEIDQIKKILSEAPEGATHVEIYNLGSVQGSHAKGYFRKSESSDWVWEIYHENTEDFGRCDGREMGDLIDFRCLSDLRVIAELH